MPDPTENRWSNKGSGDRTSEPSDTNWCGSGSNLALSGQSWHESFIVGRSPRHLSGPYSYHQSSPLSPSRSFRSSSAGSRGSDLSVGDPGKGRKVIWHSPSLKPKTGDDVGVTHFIMGPSSPRGIYRRGGWVTPTCLLGSSSPEGLGSYFLKRNRLFRSYPATVVCWSG